MAKFRFVFRVLVVEPDETTADRLILCIEAGREQVIEPGDEQSTPAELASTLLESIVKVAKSGNLWRRADPHWMASWASAADVGPDSGWNRSLTVDEFEIGLDVRTMSATEFEPKALSVDDLTQQVQQVIPGAVISELRTGPKALLKVETAHANRYELEAKFTTISGVEISHFCKHDFLLAGVSIGLDGSGSSEGYLVVELIEKTATGSLVRLPPGSTHGADSSYLEVDSSLVIEE